MVRLATVLGAGGLFVNCPLGFKIMVEGRDDYFAAFTAQACAGTLTCCCTGCGDGGNDIVLESVFVTVFELVTIFTLAIDEVVIELATCIGFNILVTTVTGVSDITVIGAIGLGFNRCVRVGKLIDGLCFLFVANRALTLFGAFCGARGSFGFCPIAPCVTGSRNYGDVFLFATSCAMVRLATVLGAGGLFVNCPLGCKIVTERINRLCFLFVANGALTLFGAFCGASGSFGFCPIAPCVTGIDFRTGCYGLTAIRANGITGVTGSGAGSRCSTDNGCVSMLASGSFCFTQVDDFNSSDSCLTVGCGACVSNTKSYGTAVYGYNIAGFNIFTV